MSKITEGGVAIQLLEQLNDTIRCADFAGIETILAQMDANLSSMPVLGRGELEKLRSLAQRNLACLAAAADGLRSGRRRVTEIAAAARGETYDRLGQKTRLGRESADSLPLLGKRL